ncbi:MAG: prolyl oligopeptidase family serine peptidase [Proteobacteria bacterium]|nr:prolyl oligopeptidase family serine peptidase [Pseudomonadota bacterium]
MFKKIITSLIFFSGITTSLHAQHLKEIDLKNNKCAVDFTKHVNANNNQCLRLVTVGNLLTHPEELIIYLHGDYGVGGASYMSTIGSHFTKSNRMHIALIRPGYFDDAGNFSTGNSLGVTSTKIAGRLDNYTRENIDIIGQAITNLKNHYQPKKLLLVGHSGGAALAALLLNEYPKLADGALLINCPCDVKHWRPDWEKSLSPIEHVNNIPSNAKIVVLNGANDDVVWPELGKAYAEELAKHGVDVKFYMGLGMGHNLSDKATREGVMSGVKEFFELGRSNDLA